MSGLRKIDVAEVVNAVSVGGLLRGLFKLPWAAVTGKPSVNTTAPLAGGGSLATDLTLTTAMSTGKLIGRTTAGTGVMEELTPAAPLGVSAGAVTVATMTGDSGSGGARGVVPAPSAGDAAAGKFLKASGAWAVPPAGITGPGTTTVDDIVTWNSITGAAVKDSGTKVSDLQPKDATLTAWAGAGAQGLAYFSDVDTVATLTLAANKGIYATGPGTLATYDLTAAGRAILDDADAAAQRTTLELGSMAVESTSSWVPSSRTINGYDLSANRTIAADDVGARIATVSTTSYYPGLMFHGAGALAVSGTVTSNRAYACPWRPERSGTVDQLAVYVAGATIGGKAGLALCSDSGGAPGSILVQGEVLTSSLGIVTTSVSQTVTAGTLYWLVLVTNNSVNTFNGIAGTSRMPWLGYDLTSTAPNVAEYVAYTYAAPIVLPSFASPTRVTTGATFFPTVFVRYSA